MKTTLLAAMVSLALAAFGQKQIEVEESISEVKEQPLFQVEIPETNLRDAEKNWLKYVSLGTRVQAVVVNGDHLQTGVVNKTVSANPFDIYSKLRKTSEGVRLYAWLPENNSVFSGSQNKEVRQAVAYYLRVFAVQEYRRVVQKELFTEQEKQKSLEKDLASLLKIEDKAVKKIGANERATGRAREAIVVNNSDIEQSSGKISDQKLRVTENASDPNAAKGARKTLSGMEGDKKDLQNKNEREGRKIDERSEQNRTAERNIESSQKDQVSVTLALEKQKQVVNELQAKLDNIK